MIPFSRMFCSTNVLISNLMFYWLYLYYFTFKNLIVRMKLYHFSKCLGLSEFYHVVQCLPSVKSGGGLKCMCTLSCRNVWFNLWICMLFFTFINLIYHILQHKKICSGFDRSTFFVYKIQTKCFFNQDI